MNAVREPFPNTPDSSLVSLLELYWGSDTASAAPVDCILELQIWHHVYVIMVTNSWNQNSTSCIELHYHPGPVLSRTCTCGNSFYSMYYDKYLDLYLKNRNETFEKHPNTWYNVIKSSETVPHLIISTQIQSCYVIELDLAPLYTRGELLTVSNAWRQKLLKIWKQTTSDTRLIRIGFSIFVKTTQ